MYNYCLTGIQSKDNPCLTSSENKIETFLSTENKLESYYSLSLENGHSTSIDNYYPVTFERNTGSNILERNTDFDTLESFEETGIIKFVRIEGGNSFINLSQLVVTDMNGKNVATTSKATSSGTGWDGPEASAIDGKEESRGLPKIYHSSAEKAWFEIELRKPVNVSLVTVYNRADCCQDRMIGYVITLMDQSRKILFNSPPLTSAGKQVIQTGIFGPPIGLIKIVALEGGNDILNFSQLVVRNINGQNVSKKAITTSSGVGEKTSESTAVDGEEASRPHPKIYHSNSQKAFFRVHLSTPAKVSLVTVWNRGDCCQERLGGYKIRLFDQNNNEIFASTPLTKEAKQVIRVIHTIPSGPATGLVRIIRLDGGNDILHFSQLVVTDINGRNVAKGATTISSGATGDGLEINAVDGEQASRPHPKIYHSTTPKAWFDIQLISPIKVSSVTVYNRADCCQERMVGYKISLIDENNNLVFMSKPLTKDAKQLIQVGPMSKPIGRPTGLVKFVRLEGGNDIINLSQLVVTDMNGKNVAKGAITSSSGVGSDGAEANAVDGEEASRPHPKEYHSSTPKAWFHIDLFPPTKVASVTVYNRADCCQERMIGYKIILYDENNNIAFTSNPLTKEAKQLIQVSTPEPKPEPKPEPVSAPATSPVTKPAPAPAPAPASAPAPDSSGAAAALGFIIFIFVLLIIIIFFMTRRKSSNDDD